jgi:hypothetical protein
VATTIFRRAATNLLTMAHLFAKLFILMLADFFTPLFNNASHSSLLSGILNHRFEAECPPAHTCVRTVGPRME